MCTCCSVSASGPFCELGVSGSIYDAQGVEVQEGASVLTGMEWSEKLDLGKEAGGGLGGDGRLVRWAWRHFSQAIGSRLHVLPAAVRPVQRPRGLWHEAGCQ